MRITRSMPARSGRVETSAPPGRVAHRRPPGLPDLQQRHATRPPARPAAPRGAAAPVQSVGAAVQRASRLERRAAGDRPPLRRERRAGSHQQVGLLRRRQPGALEQVGAGQRDQARQRDGPRGSRRPARAPPGECRWRRAAARRGASATRKRRASATVTAPVPVRDLPDGDRRAVRVAPQPLGDLGDGRLGEQLGLRTRDEGAAIGPNAQPEPFLVATEVGHRLTGGSPLDQPASCEQRRRQLVLPVAHEPGAVAAKQVAEEQLRIQPRGRSVRRLESPRRVTEHLAQRRAARGLIGQRSSAPSSARRSCWSRSPAARRSDPGRPPGCREGCARSCRCGGR